MPAEVDHPLHTRFSMKTLTFPAFLTLLGVVMIPAVALAQTPAPAPPPPGWAGSASAGLALTSGNSDTSTVNAAYELKRDTGSPIVIKSNGLLVYGKSEDLLTNDRLALDGRVERRLTTRTSLFGQTQYLRDSFKAIDYLVSPTVGVSQILLKDDRTELAADAAVGVVWEQNPDLELQTDGAVTAGQQFSRKLTATTELKQKAAALWKMDDFGDALYSVGIGIAASITAATQMKVEFLDTYKARPPVPTVQKNDIAVLVSFVYKFE
jgi:putative salt-induced outer membrane protein YdiY